MLHFYTSPFLFSSYCRDYHYAKRVSSALESALKQGNRMQVSSILHKISKEDLEHTFILAAQRGFLLAVDYLIQNKMVNPALNDNQAIQQASYTGQVAMVQYLLRDTRVNPSAHKNWSLSAASFKGHIEVVKVLLNDPRVNPCDEDFYALKMAAQNLNLQMMEMLLEAIPDNHQDKALKMLKCYRRDAYQLIKNNGDLPTGEESSDILMLTYKKFCSSPSLCINESTQENTLCKELNSSCCLF